MAKIMILTFFPKKYAWPPNFDRKNSYCYVFYETVSIGPSLCSMTDGHHFLYKLEICILNFKKKGRSEIAFLNTT